MYFFVTKFLYLNSEAISTSTDILSTLSKKYFPTKAA
jgi:hypothetical protein